jgi:tRNA modification GTPase
MNFLYSDEAIIACSTSTFGNAGIAVIRISGFSDLSSFQPFFSLDFGPIEPRRVYYTQILDGQTQVDDICLTYFKGPKSYNGENILELSVHGNTLNVERIIQLFITHKLARAAGPGEFTYRALKNRKLTLSQVEGLDLLLNANSSYALDQGLSLLNGQLHQIYLDLQDLFLKHKSALELSIDFSEDIGEEAAKEYFNSTLAKFSEKFEILKKRVAPMDQHLLQPEITLAGLPNSGKSSLFNLLLSDDRAIVSPIAGTTRDYLSEHLMIEGVRYRLVDTAGIRDARDEIEKEGIRRSHKKLKDSFFSVLLINPLETSPDLAELLNHQFDMILFTHADCSDFDIHKNLLIEIFPKLGSIGAVDLTKSKTLEANLFNAINNKYLSVTSSQPILLERHKQMIAESATSLRNYKDISSFESDVAILSEELNALGHCLSELIGIVSPDQILNSVFDNFCIGK